jgi:hypothetical protein
MLVNAKLNFQFMNDCNTFETIGVLFLMETSPTSKKATVLATELAFAKHFETHHAF